jgi:hypothetical protein
MRLNKVTLISREVLIALNRNNEDLALTDAQIEYFLKVQHSLGKILYFDQHGLEKFIIVQPQSLVNILRSFITDEHFWPNDESLRDILGLQSIDFRVIFVFCIYKEDVVVYYTLMLFMILKHFFEAFGQPFSPVNTIFL